MQTPLKKYIQALPEWREDESDRRAVLFNPFPPREVNPHDWDSRMMFWKKCVLEAAESTGAFMFTLRELQDACACELGLQPQGLTVVVETLKQEGVLELKDEFAVKESWGSWLASSFAALVIGDKKKASLAVESVLVAGGLVRSFADALHAAVVSERLFTGDAVFWQDSLLTRPQSSDGTMLWDKVYAKILSTHPQAAAWEPHVWRQNIELSLRALAHQGRVVLADICGAKAVKFLEPNAPAVITDADKGLLSVHSAIEKLRKQSHTLSTAVDKCLLSIKISLKEKKRSQALQLLRRKKLLEDTVEKYNGRLQTLEIVALQILSAADDQEILSAFCSATATLRSCTEGQGVTPDSVDEAMLSLEEALDTQKEIDTALQMGTTSIDGIDEAELEAELASLVLPATPLPATPAQTPTSGMKAPATSAQTPTSGMKAPATPAQTPATVGSPRPPMVPATPKRPLNPVHAQALSNSMFPKVPSHTPPALEEADKETNEPMLA